MRASARAPAGGRLGNANGCAQRGTAAQRHQGVDASPYRPPIWILEPHSAFPFSESKLRQ